MDTKFNKDQSSSFFGDTPKNSFETSGDSKTTPPIYQEYGREQQKKLGPQYTATIVPSTSAPNKIPDNVHFKSQTDKMNSTQIKVPGPHQETKPVSEGLTPNLIQNKININNPVSANLQPQLNPMEMKILDYMAKLYKFNYTLSFHGHEEIGDFGGNKNGSYFSNGRDGYQRKVVYVANEFGYQPKISLIKLDDEFVPKEETEKELTKLKGSEFIWFFKKK